MTDIVAQVLERAARRAEQAALRNASESSDEDAGDQATETKRRPGIAWGWLGATQHPQIIEKSAHFVRTKKIVSRSTDRS